MPLCPKQTTDQQSADDDDDDGGLLLIFAHWKGKGITAGPGGISVRLKVETIF